MYQKKANSQKKVNFLTIQDLNNLISSAIPAITILGTIFGASITYKYLDSINQKSIFPDIIDTPSAFLSVSIVFSLILFCLFLSLSIPYSILFFNENKKTESKRIIYGMNQLLFCLVSCSPIFLFLILVWVELNSRSIVALMLISPLLIYLIGTYYYERKFLKKCKNAKGSKNFKNIKIKNFWWGATFSFFIPFLANFYPVVFIFIPISNNWINTNYHDIFFFVTLFLPMANIILSSFVIFNVNFSNKEKILALYSFLFIISFCFFFASINISNNFPSRLLLPLRIIESNQNSSWYLIHGKYNEKEINGINAFDLHTIKLNFSCTETKDENCSKTTNNRKNALYGYMAWNLGDTKVFCPKSVSFLDQDAASNIEEKSSKCIVIKNEFIQILDNRYIQ